MKLYLKIIILILTFTLILSYGCSDRGTNSNGETNLKTGSLIKIEGAHVFFNELLLQIKNKFQQLQIITYTPQADFPDYLGGKQKPVPLLVLLPPRYGDANFYFDHGLKELADELISKGIIQPMAIACISNDKIFGGYFYAGHSPAAGNYDTLVGGTLMKYLRTILPFTIDSVSKTGIGGVGMGAYGAFRAALLHKGVFSSISAVDGPLDFDGADGNSGFLSLFSDALNEQGLLGGTTDTLHPSWVDRFDSSSSKPLSQLFIGGALAFSPHDTAVTWDTSYNQFTHIQTITITSRQSITDSTTLVKNIINQDEHNLDFLLPFDSLGQPYPPIWNMWVSNNLENILADSSSALNGVNMWIATSPETNFANYHSQTLSWINTLTNPPYNFPVETLTYKGYSGNPANNDQYIYDLMRAMLIFHSDNFGN
ncbi:MAG: hypothetical protein GXO93_00670 [FCB group bacterium]|nr:hypothetical protein [FCB group bacterium]